MRYPILDDRDLEEIERIGRLRAPNEAGGLMVPRSHPVRGATVRELPNRSPRPLDGTRILLDDLRYELGDWLGETPQEVVEKLVVWHTHPGGLIGPSQDDLRQAVPDVPFLVVTLLPDRAVPTWYSRVSREVPDGGD